MPTERELADTLKGVSPQLPAVPDKSSTALAIAPSSAWESTYKYSLKEIHGIANTACQANIFTNTADASKAVVRIFWGLENGLTPMESLNDVYESKGRFYIFADGVVTQLAKRGAHVVFTETSPKVCTGHIEHDGEIIGLPVSVTIEQAAAMGVLDKPAWKSDPESMLCARVISRLNKRVGKRFWQTTVGVREEAEDVEWIDRANLPQDPATKAIASAGRRRAKPEVQEVEAVDEPPKDGEAEASATRAQQSTAQKEVEFRESAKPASSTSKPQTMPAKELKKPVSAEQQTQLLAALDESGLTTEDHDKFMYETYGCQTDEEFNKVWNFGSWQASMLWVQGKAEGVR